MNTFNPLFPRVQYFSEAGFFGATNIVSLHPGMNVHPTKRLAVAVDSLVFWRENRLDAAYSPALTPLLKTDNHERYLGTQLGGQIAWKPLRHVSLLAYYGHLFAGKYFRGTPQRHADYVTTYITLHL